MTLTTAKWKIDDYHRMIAAGILTGRQVELLNGEVVEMAPEENPTLIAVMRRENI